MGTVQYPAKPEEGFFSQQTTGKAGSVYGSGGKAAEGKATADQETEAATAAYEALMSQQPPSVSQQYVRQTPKAAMYKFAGGPTSGAGGGMVSPYAQPHAAGQPLPTASMAGPGMATGQLAGMYSPLTVGRGEGGGGGGPGGGLTGTLGAGGEVQPGQGADLQAGQGVGTPGATGAAGGPWDEKPAAGETLGGDYPTWEDPETYNYGETEKGQMGETDFHGQPWDAGEVEGVLSIENKFGIGWEERNQYTEFTEPDYSYIEDARTESEMGIQQAQAASQRNLNATLSQAGMDPGSSHIQGIKIGAYWANVNREANQELNAMEKGEKDKAAKQKLIEDDEYYDAADEAFDQYIGQFHATAPATGGLLNVEFSSWAERQFMDMVRMGASPTYIRHVLTQLTGHWLRESGEHDIWSKGTFEAADQKLTPVANIFSQEKPPKVKANL